jgi:hypothetical protein
MFIINTSGSSSSPRVHHHHLRFIIITVFTGPRFCGFAGNGNMNAAVIQPSIIMWGSSSSCLIHHHHHHHHHHHVTFIIITPGSSLSSCQVHHHLVRSIIIITRRTGPRFCGFAGNGEMNAAVVQPSIIMSHWGHLDKEHICPLADLIIHPDCQRERYEDRMPCFVPVKDSVIPASHEDFFEPQGQPPAVDQVLLGPGIPAACLSVCVFL